MSDQIEDASPLTAKRTDLQWPRRLFHMLCGIAVAFMYQVLFTHSQAVYLLGFIACIVYIFEQVRVNYPELANTFWLPSRYLLRAEEQLKESAQVPYMMGLLLTLLSFPKTIAIASILTLAIADPLSAIIGIRYGKNRIVKHKSLEGSAAFFLGCLGSLLISFSLNTELTLPFIILSIFIAFIVSIFEMIPIKIDDNLTIPLFTAAITWIALWLLSLPI